MSAIEFLLMLTRMHGITIAAELAHLAEDEGLEDGNAFLLLEDSDNKDIAKSCRKSANPFTLEQ